MTLEEFQSRLRAICEAHVVAAKAAQAAFNDGLNALAEDCRAEMDANPEAFAAVAGVEIARMQRAMQP